MTGRFRFPPENFRAVLIGILPVLCPFFIIPIVFVVLGLPPLDTLVLIANGAAGTWMKFGYTLMLWVPVMMCCCGLAVTFSAGIWNIGIEGQIVMGAVFATGALRMMSDRADTGFVVFISALFAAFGGGVWALVCAALKRYGRINEIFSGLGLNFIAGSLTVYLVLGPWKRPGIGSTSGTEPFPPGLWLTAPSGFNVSWVEMILAILSIALTGLLLNKTRIGLKLRATGLNPVAAFRLGLPSSRLNFLALGLCGALAGLAGYLMVVGTSARHNLYPLISGGFGFLAIMIILLARSRILTAAWIAMLFAIISTGSMQLSIQHQLDSALGGMIQGLIVLLTLIAGGFLQIRRQRNI